MLRFLKAFLCLFLVNAVSYATEPSNPIFDSKASPQILIETSMGSFILELDRQKAPNTVSNFLTYVDMGFYGGTLFHRVIPGFMVQAGGFTSGMNKKKTLKPVVNESANGNKNSRGTISMARTQDPDSATSQFFINVRDNRNLDTRNNQPGYTVFGRVSKGMDVIDSIVAVTTKTVGSYQDIPIKDVLILSAERINQDTDSLVNSGRNDSSDSKQAPYINGVHYRQLKNPVPTRNTQQIEVVLGFSYICPHCFEFEPFIEAWRERQQDDIDFHYLPAVWNESMELFARVYLTAQFLEVEEMVRQSMFRALLIEQKRLSNIDEIADFVSELGVDKVEFLEAYYAEHADKQIEQVRSKLSSYNLAGVPEIIVNGKYRIDRVRAGGLSGMLKVLDYLVRKEKALMKNG